jgi:hypothetical protein
VLVGLRSYNASDPANARAQGVTPAGFALRVEEDISLNAETSHGAETFSWATFDSAGDTR